MSEITNMYNGHLAFFRHIRFLKLVPLLGNTVHLTTELLFISEKNRFLRYIRKKMIKIIKVLRVRSLKFGYAWWSWKRYCFLSFFLFLYECIYIMIGLVSVLKLFLILNNILLQHLYPRTKETILWKEFYVFVQDSENQAGNALLPWHLD
jgi:hypothetical protein